MTVHRQSLGTWDYVVIMCSFAISFGIGVVFYYAGRGRYTAQNFFMANNNMSKFPVVLSIVVTNLSAILMLGAPAEVYRYGTQIVLLTVGMTVGILLASYLILPIYFDLRITTVYEYLEMRYGKFIRYTVSSLFIVQTLLYVSVVLYAPALALSAVTDLSTEMSIIFMGVVCTLYCSIGGLKAVLWTDVFQSGLMSACIAIVFLKGVTEVGGLGKVLRRSSAGGRLEFFNFNMDLTTRYTVWNSLLRGLSLGFAGYGVSQLEVQRLLSINHIKHARRALLMSLMPNSLIVLLCYFMGIVLYSIFYQCDPILDQEQTGLTKYDQLVPYYIVTRLSSVPGLTGLCIAGLFSGSLSTISSAINSLSTVTVMDIIQPYCGCSNLSETGIVFLAKSIVLLYGSMCIMLTFLMAHIGSLTQMATVTLGVMEGPVAAIFLLGIITTTATEKGSLIGFVVGCAMSGWIGFGSSLSGYSYNTLPLSIQNCSLPENDTGMNFSFYQNSSFKSSENFSKEVFLPYKISYMWIPTIGFLCTFCFSYAASIIIDWNQEKGLHPSYFSPLVRRWILNSEDTEKLENIVLERKEGITIPDVIKPSTISNFTSDSKL